MKLLIEIQVESTVNFVDWWRFVLTLLENWASLDIMQENIELMGLARKSSIVEKHIQVLLPANLLGYPNWFSRWCFRWQYGRWVGIRR
jgi:hypothetical protein